MTDFAYRGYTIRVGHIGWTVRKDDRAVAAGGVFGGAPQDQLRYGQRVVRDLIAGRRKPFPAPDIIPAADREVASRMLKALNAGMRDFLK